MFDMKTIKLPCYGIEVQVDIKYPTRGAITSTGLHDNEFLEEIERQANGETDRIKDRLEKEQFEGSMDAIEAMILGHACAGVDIETPAYIQGIESAVQACANEYS